MPTHTSVNRSSIERLVFSIEIEVYTLREEPSKINVILQLKLPAAKLNAVCTVYKLIVNLWLQLCLKNC